MADTPKLTDTTNNGFNTYVRTNELRLYIPKSGEHTIQQRLVSVVTGKGEWVDIQIARESEDG